MVFYTHAADPEACVDASCDGPPSRRWWIVAVYGFIAVLWIAITHALKIAPWTDSARAHGINGKMGWFVFFIPLFVLAVAAFTVARTDGYCRLQNAVRGGNILYLGILVAIPLFTLLDSSYKGDRAQFATIVLVSMALAVLSQLDIWGDQPWTCVVQHGESALKTLSLGLLLFVLLLYSTSGKYLTSSPAA